MYQYFTNLLQARLFKDYQNDNTPYTWVLRPTFNNGEYVVYQLGGE